MAGLHGREWSFSRSIRQAPVSYGLLFVETVGGTAFSLLHVNPIMMLVLVAVINGVAAAPFLFVVMRLSNSPSLMGKHVNRLTAEILGWLTVAIMAAAAIALFATGGL
jgi:Mn2+/Fe2+ NRAMP family transporter